ncbi:MAG: M28 family peptidase [Leptolyngbyaceae cyanobacterium]
MVNLPLNEPPDSPLGPLRARLATHLQHLVGNRDPYLASGGHQLTQQYLRSVLSTWGDVIADDFQVRGQHHCNWILQLPGTASARPPIIIGAHYDTIPGTPGADDNASGLAVLLEVARYLATCSLARPCWLIAFDMEEFGLLGSQALATKLQATQQAVHLMLSLEMLGYCDRTPGSQRYPTPWLTKLYPDRGDFIALIGNLCTLRAMQKLRRHLRQANAPCEYLPVPNAGRWVPATRRSDHASFWDCGYPALMVTDTAFLRNPHYHQPSDHLETLDLDFMTGVCWGLMRGLAALA